ncbi:heterokaryon incompatibility protein-domain-containing protein [Podospora aff. communis PSN243]|uniref:Heterokaryon incompatibility protein-domain-containing protein n=1 Tax=Podospora aff. communis PSN243 TaxID=3040156 RepID=A0AAV9H7U9_9PEZI|nr:heterokaryon incompatibility protein-domain-containing protein [Podospora aff. communis PSN243]
MWLINTRTRKLEFFAGPPDRYTILSHTWVDRQEISFQDFLRLQAAHPDPNDEAISRLRARSGHDKILRCCRLAEEKGLPYAWVDTCCIDKTSSAELSESINSMFAWYKCAAVCFAYLQDVQSTSDTKTKDCEPSRWYSRGWTLQELIAPLHVEFYNTSWQKIGTKWSLREEISSITSISELDLIFFDPGRTSVAQKMSWAARRDTTRSEDIAYCLLGIFGIHMPLLYGEGRDAFRRLQEELLKVSSDQTIFAWMHPKWQKALPWGMLACSPASFSDSGQITQSCTQSKAPPIILHDAARQPMARSTTPVYTDL